MGVVDGEGEAAWEVVARFASTVHLAVVADAPARGVLMESLIEDLGRSGGRWESKGCPRTGRVHIQPILPALDAEPSCVDCSVDPTRLDVLVVQIPSGFRELSVIRSVEAPLAVVAIIGALVAGIVQPSVGDDGGRADDDLDCSASSVPAPAGGPPGLQDGP